MRFPRQTYRGAFHHVTCRGLGDVRILSSVADKKYFLKLLAEKTKLTGIRLFAYCLMDNHYHLALENRTARLSDFLKQLNGQYGQHYRRRTGTRGYVFQDRFYSSLVQDDSYLIQVIRYILLNPVKAGLTASALAYPWSSADSYFSKDGHDWLASEFVEGLFRSRQGLISALGGAADEPLPIIKSRLGPVVGDEDFIEKAAIKFDRRMRSTNDKRMRLEDHFFEPPEKVIHEFEREHKTKMGRIDCSIHSGKRLRGELLVRLHDLAGMKYAEIAELPLFSDIKFHSLGHLYKKAKKRENEKVKNYPTVPS
jgi:REP element-mobilizing transposase RayT